MLKTETGNPKVSFDNTIHLIVQHGPVVGVIHRVHPNNTHSTFIFFWNEYVHEATGFACGEESINSLYFQSLVSMIPGCNRNVEADIVSMIGSKIDNLYVKAQKELKTIHYIFKPNSVIGEQAIVSLGYKVFEIYCQEIYTEDKGYMMEVERPN
jgi:hypothetical protein